VQVSEKVKGNVLKYKTEQKNRRLTDKLVFRWTVTHWYSTPFTLWIAFWVDTNYLYSWWVEEHGTTWRRPTSTTAFQRGCHARCPRVPGPNTDTL